MKLRIIALLPLLLATPALAQDTYEPADAEALQSCVDDVAASLGDDSEDNDGNYRDCLYGASNACQEEPGGSSTSGIAQCNERETAWWDERLNQQYASLKQSLAPDAFAALQKAQRAWIGFRDADCNFTYEQWKDGTISQVFYSACLLDRTASRAIELIQAGQQ